MKEYKSFEEVDKDLEILKIRREVEQEEVKLSVAQTKMSLSPWSLISSLLGTLLQKIVMLKIFTKLTGFKLKS